MAGRNLVLFSDGTGNSSSKLQKTNVWRLYEALDLGDPAKPSQREQIAYYDDGVGNSSFRLLAVLGGVFGFGLARNVRELYTFFCRNYREDDRVFAFGYSRGSYTIRLLVAMIAQFGPVSLTKTMFDPATGQSKTVALSQIELDLQVRDRWRAFRRAFHTNWRASDFVVLTLRYLRALFISGKRALFHRGYQSQTPQTLNPATWITEWMDYWTEQSQRGKSGEQYSRDTWIKAKEGARHDIRFVGVFDTVAAYGGPVVEINRAIDDWFWPLTMPDYRLNPRVQTARHALAIDDKRGSFDPLLWDEVFERANPDFDPDNPRLRQVWFAGMHSDVGGGYSDESLSFVPLYWMIEHAEKAGLHFIPPMRERIKDYANPHGFMHDSRRGFGAFYRYQPRYINAWVDKRTEDQLAALRAPGPATAPETDARGKPKRYVKKATGVFRDQVIDGGRYRTQGFLVRPIHIHTDTVKRIRVQSDGYAPVNLVRHMRQDDGIRGAHEFTEGLDLEREAFVELGTRVRIRRFWYFVTMLLLTLVVGKFGLATYASYPLGDEPCDEFAGLDMADAMCRGTNVFLPETLAVFVGHLFSDVLVLAGLLALLGFTTWRGMRQENILTDLARNNWTQAFSQGAGAKAVIPRGWLLTRQLYTLAWSLKQAKNFQRFLALLKWHVFPLVIGAGTWIVLIVVGLPWLLSDGLPWLDCQLLGGWLASC